jgi:hypothetical protein
VVPATPLLVRSTTNPPSIVRPDGSVPATVPAGQDDGIGAAFTSTRNPWLSNVDVAAWMVWQVTFGIPRCVPYAIFSSGRGKSCRALPRMMSASVSYTAGLTMSWLMFEVVSGQSVSARMPATAIDRVVTTSDAVRLLSVVPVLPAIGCPMVVYAALEVEPLHSPNADWSPTGHRAASIAARATSRSTA